MSHKKEKISPRIRRQRRVRRKVRGGPERPRLCVFRSLKHIYVQAIDDVSGVTIACASSLESAFPWPEKPEAQGEEKVSAKKGKKAKKAGKAAGTKVVCGERVGELIATRLKEKGITSAVFDRNGFLYHGRVKAVAEAARKGGLGF